MARRKAAKEPQPKPNPYATADDDALEAEYAEALERYIERMSYFEQLPPGFRATRAAERILAAAPDPERYGITRGEYDEYKHDLVMHAVEGAKMSLMSQERSRRMRERERQRIRELPLAELAAITDADMFKTLIDGITYREGEPVADFIRRSEAAWEAFTLASARMSEFDARVGKMPSAREKLDARALLRR